MTYRQVMFSSAQSFQLGDVVKFAQPPAPKWWRKLEAWRRVFGLKPRTWRKHFKVIAVSGNKIDVQETPYQRGNSNG